MELLLAEAGSGSVRADRGDGDGAVVGVVAAGLDVVGVVRLFPFRGVRVDLQLAVSRRGCRWEVGWGVLQVGVRRLEVGRWRLKWGIECSVRVGCWKRW